MNGSFILLNLGMITSVSDFSKDLVFVEKREQVVNKTYSEPKIKKSPVDWAEGVQCFNRMLSRDEQTSRLS